VYSQCWYEYNSIGRGLAALLILGEGQCEGLNAGMGEKVRISHAFFVSIHLMFNQPRQGERVGREQGINMKRLLLLPMMLLSIMLMAQNPMVTIDNITYSIHGEDDAVVLYGRQCTGDVIIQKTVSYKINNWPYYATVRSIDVNAFSCSTLTSVTIPSTVRYIGNDAFSGCSGLTSVVSEIETPFAFGSSAFWNIASNCTLTVPAGTKDAYIAAGWSESVFKGGIIEKASNITFADANVKSLCVANWDTNGDGELSEEEAAAVTDLGTVFQNNTTITTFNELQHFTGMTRIGNNAFYGCTELSSLTIPNSVASIGEYALSGCI
jgi:hypothetical protein